MPHTGIQTDGRDVTEVAPRAFMVGAALFLAAWSVSPTGPTASSPRWWKANHPFAGAIPRYERMGTTYRERRANVTEVAEVFGEIFTEASRALEANSPRGR